MGGNTGDGSDGCGGGKPGIPRPKGDLPKDMAAAWAATFCWAAAAMFLYRFCAAPGIQRPANKLFCWPTSAGLSSFSLFAASA